LRAMAGWDDVRRAALAMPEAIEGESHGLRGWSVRKKGFVWERPLRKADVAALGADAPDGDILGVRVEHVGAKYALLETGPDVYFTTPHFDGYPAVLVRLDAITPAALEELVAEAWLAVAPKRLAAAWLQQG
jgi:hypothetical protein